MTTVFYQDGDAIDYTPSGADVAAGEVVVQGELVAVAKRKILDGELGALHVKGVFDFPKTAGVGEAITAGALVYWSGTVATETAAGNKLIGKTVKAATDDDTTVRARLDQ